MPLTHFGSPIQPTEYMPAPEPPKDGGGIGKEAPIKESPEPSELSRIADALERIVGILEAVQYRGSIVTSTAETDPVGWRAEP